MANEILKTQEGSVEKDYPYLYARWKKEVKILGSVLAFINPLVENTTVSIDDFMRSEGYFWDQTIQSYVVGGERDLRQITWLSKK